jgi:hypothetical protein
MFNYIRVSAVLNSAFLVEFLDNVMESFLLLSSSGMIRMYIFSEILSTFFSNDRMKKQSKLQ